MTSGSETRPFRGLVRNAKTEESSYAWLRLLTVVLLSTVGSVGMWSVVVALPAVQADFGASRGAVSLAYTLAMVGYACGGVLTGRLADRFGSMFAVLLGATALSLGYAAAAHSGSLAQFALAHGLLIGIGSSATFGPLMADISHWFNRNRGIAVALCACGNYLAGTIWPPLVQHFIASVGWRTTHSAIAVICLAVMLPLALVLRRRRPESDSVDPKAVITARPLPVSRNALQLLLVIAGFACCVAMSMPQVHIVAYCGDLGYGVARGAEMLSLMLGFGIISRIASGLIADRIGGLRTLLLGSLLQAVALSLYLGFDSLVSLYVISALFGLFQGGIVPSYPIIVREYFPPEQAGTRVGIVLMATLFGMALGGFLSGMIFDATGSYRAAFLNGLLWNAVNVAIVVWLLRRSAPQPALA